MSAIDTIKTEIATLLGIDEITSQIVRTHERLTNLDWSDINLRKTEGWALLLDRIIESMQREQASTADNVSDADDSTDIPAGAELEQETEVSDECATMDSEYTVEIVLYTGHEGNVLGSMDSLREYRINNTILYGGDEYLVKEYSLHPLSMDKKAQFARVEPITESFDLIPDDSTFYAETADTHTPHIIEYILVLLAVCAVLLHSYVVIVKAIWGISLILAGWLYSEYIVGWVKAGVRLVNELWLKLVLKAATLG